MQINKNNYSRKVITTETNTTEDNTTKHNIQQQKRKIITKIIQRQTMQMKKTTKTTEEKE